MAALCLIRTLVIFTVNSYHVFVQFHEERVSNISRLRNMIFSSWNVSILFIIYMVQFSDCICLFSIRSWDAWEVAPASYSMVGWSISGLVLCEYTSARNHLLSRHKLCFVSILPIGSYSIWNMNGRFYSLHVNVRVWYVSFVYYSNTYLTPLRLLEQDYRSL